MITKQRSSPFTSQALAGLAFRDLCAAQAEQDDRRGQNREARARQNAPTQAADERLCATRLAAQSRSCSSDHGGDYTEAPGVAQLYGGVY